MYFTCILACILACIPGGLCFISFLLPSERVRTAGVYIPPSSSSGRGRPAEAKMHAKIHARMLARIHARMHAKIHVKIHAKYMLK